jgi:IPT/TIG domain
VPEGENTYEYPEQLLAGSDRPRPLPPLLRARLEEALEGLAGAEAVTAARPLSGDVRDKLAVSLRSEEPDEPEETDGSEEPQEPEKKWRTWAPRLSVAAAVIIALAIFVPTLSRGPNSVPGASHTAAGVQVSRAGLSIRGLPPTNVAGAAQGQPAATTSTAPSTNAPTPTIPRAGLTPAAGTGTPTRLGPDKSSVGTPSAAFATSAPVVNSLSPATGPHGGGNWVTVRGEDLSGASVVYFGRVPALRVSVVSGSELRALAPAHAAGTVDVVVKGPAGQSKGSAADRYSFSP